MRGFVPFLLMIASGVVATVLIGIFADLALTPVCIGFALGATTLLVGAIVVNTCNASRYGRQVFEDGPDSDFVEPECGSRRVGVRRGRGRGFHETYFSDSEASVRDE